MPLVGRLLAPPRRRPGLREHQRCPRRARLEPCRHCAGGRAARALPPGWLLPNAVRWVRRRARAAEPRRAGAALGVRPDGRRPRARAALGGRARRLSQRVRDRAAGTVPRPPLGTRTAQTRCGTRGPTRARHGSGSHGDRRRARQHRPLPPRRLSHGSRLARCASHSCRRRARQARQLLQRGVPAVIYCEGRISDAAAAEFSRGFYEALASGCAVPQAPEPPDLARLRPTSRPISPDLA